jgi:hypothetical protein
MSVSISLSQSIQKYFKWHSVYKELLQTNVGEYHTVVFHVESENKREFQKFNINSMIEK